MCIKLNTVGFCELPTTILHTIFLLVTQIYLLRIQIPYTNYLFMHCLYIRTIKKHEIFLSVFDILSSVLYSIPVFIKDFIQHTENVLLFYS